MYSFLLWSLTVYIKKKIHLPSIFSYCNYVCSSYVRILKFLDPDDAVRFIDFNATVICSNCGEPNSRPELFLCLDSKQLAIFKIAVSGDSTVRGVLLDLLNGFNVVQTGNRIFFEIYRYFLSIHFPPNWWKSTYSCQSASSQDQSPEPYLLETSCQTIHMHNSFLAQSPPSCHSHAPGNSL